MFQVSPPFFFPLSFVNYFGLLLHSRPRGSNLFHRHSHFHVQVHLESCAKTVMCVLVINQLFCTEHTVILTDHSVRNIYAHSW